MISSHYKGESQTLTTGAEANMLKLKELMGNQTPEEAARWTEIKELYVKDKVLKGDETDPMVQVVAQLSHFSDHLSNIQKVIKSGLEKGLAQPQVIVKEEKKTPKKGGIKFAK